MCGITTGKEKKCYWDCTKADIATILRREAQVAKKPECLLDCFPSDHCINSLLVDYVAARGICAEGFFGTVGQLGPWNLSSVPCSTHPQTPLVLSSGLCRQETEDKLVMEECISTVFTTPSLIFDTLNNLVLNMCTNDVWNAWLQYQRERERESWRNSSNPYGPRYIAPPTLVEKSSGMTGTSLLGPALHVEGLKPPSYCGGRFRCRAPNGQCCLLAQDTNGLVCPLSC